MAACCQEIFLTSQERFWETSELRMKFAKLETFLITLEIFDVMKGASVQYLDDGGQSNTVFSGSCDENDLDFET